jgi:hypothetical protein
VFAFRYGGALVRRPLSVGADGTVEVMDLKVKGALALGPAPAPPAATPSDPTGAVAAAEALREQLAQGLGIGDDTGIAVAITNPVVGPGRVEFTIEVADAEGVGPVTVTIRGRVNVGTTLVDDGLGLLPASLPRGQILRRAIDVSVAANVKGDVIVAVTAYGIHPQAGLVSASVARLLGTIV